MNLSISTKIIISTILLSFYYFIAPMVFSESISTIPFYSEFKFDLHLIYFQLLSSILVSIGIIFSSSKIKSILSEFNKDIYLKRLNQIISDYSVIFMCLSSFPLFLGISGGLSDRTESYEFILSARQNVFLSVIFSIALISSTLQLIDGNKRNFIILAVLVVFPELVFGTRISAFRMLFLILIFSPWNLKYFIIGFTSLLLIGMSRAIFTNYSSSNLIDFLILFFGDPLNVAFGTSLLYQSEGITCGIDGLHFFRILLPPFGMRNIFDEYIGDVTVCINSKDFGGMGVFGLGGSISNDFLVAPFSTIIFYTIMLFMSKTNWLIKYSPLLKVYVPLLILSCGPYIMRNGLIASINHISTVIIWILIPLLIIVKFFIKPIKSRNTEITEYLFKDKNI